MNEDIEGHLRDLRAAPDAPYQGLGPAAARVRAAERRRHQRGAFVTGVMVLVIAVTGIVALGFERDTTHRIRPATPPSKESQVWPWYEDEQKATESPSAGSSASRVTSLGRIDWKNSVMNMPENTMCPHRRVQFTDGKASFGPWQYSILRFGGDPVYGDVNRDGHTDAIVVIECHGDADTGGPESRFVLAAFTGNAKGGPTPIGIVDEMQAYVDPVITLRDGGYYIFVDYNSPSDTMQRTYEWGTGKFTRIDD
ncbi:hypothetical protein [Cryptosporangium minutisporangium]|uniref:VCBS repeat-containing protein n=1 Tax=Cryptosporangium minutisporangium TaxID=113569 RepID=A0ABP6T8I6_9ACTN